MNPKWRTYAIAGAMMALKYGLPALKQMLSPDTFRMCPKCAREEVRVVARTREKVEGKRKTYSLCFACNHHYQSFGDGPFRTVSDEDWSRHVPKNAKRF